MKKPSRFPEVAIVGMGLIGGSLGLALSRSRVSVCGVDIDRASLDRARRAKAAARTTSSIREAVKKAGIVVICVPVHRFKGCLEAVSRHAPADAVITDVVSVKAPIMDWVYGHLRRPERFVGGHPMAGRERSGFSAASADLFRGRLCILTPGRRSSSNAMRTVAALWRLAGSRIACMTARRHDAAVARTSHLPHAIAGALVREVLGSKGLADFVSGSFLDATRVALSSSELWKEILIANRREVSAAIRDFAASLRKFGAGIKLSDRRRVGGILSQGRKLRGRLGLGQGK